MSATSEQIKTNVVSLKNEPTALMVDEFAELYFKIISDLDKYEVLKKKLGAVANLNKEDGPIVLQGYEHSIDYTKAAETLVCNVDPKTFVEAIGDWSSVSISSTISKKMLAPEQIAFLFDKKPGSRRFRRVR
jgi:hypothetical protein